MRAALKLSGKVGSDQTNVVRVTINTNVRQAVSTFMADHPNRFSWVEVENVYVADDFIEPSKRS